MEIQKKYLSISTKFSFSFCINNGFISICLCFKRSHWYCLTCLMISPRFVLLANKWNCVCGIHSTQRNRGYENIILFTKPVPMQDQVLQKMCGFEPQLLRCILSPRGLRSRWFSQGRVYKQATRAAMPQVGWGGSRCTALCPNKLNHQLRRLKLTLF